MRNSSVIGMHFSRRGATMFPKRKWNCACTGYTRSFGRALGFVHFFITEISNGCHAYALQFVMLTGCMAEGRGDVKQLRQRYCGPTIILESQKPSNHNRLFCASDIQGFFA